MPLALVPRSLRRPAASGLLALALLGGCDDPAELAQEVVQARGECDEDGLQASSEECVRMFERYAEMATRAIHTYIGGMKAMDAALKRLPPADFDTAGLGHPITLPVEGGAGPTIPYPAVRPPTRPRDGYSTGEEWSRHGGMGPFDPRGAPPFDALDGYGPPDYPGRADPRYGEDPPFREDPGYDDGVRGAPAARRPGVLLPPAERLERPWLVEEEAIPVQRRRARELPVDPYRSYDRPYPDTLDLPPRGWPAGRR